MTLDEFMNWLHEDRNNWVRCNPGDLYNYLEEAYEEIQQLKENTPPHPTPPERHRPPNTPTRHTTCTNSSPKET